MNLILTMAGLYQRFSDEGFKIPKYLLPWGGSAILAVIIEELNRHQDFENIILVANQKDEVYLPHVRAIMRANKIPDTHLVVTGNTVGQAETAIIGIESLDALINDKSNAIAFHNIDTIIYNRKYSNIPKILDENLVYIDVFKSNNKGYSYVLTDGRDLVTSIKEKIVLSNSATSGFYVFKNHKIFKNYYKKGDIFISTVIDRVVSDGKNVFVGPLYKGCDTVVLGTPTEYLNASALII